MDFQYESGGPKPLTPPVRDLQYLEYTLYYEYLMKTTDVERGCTSPSVEGSAPE